MQVLQALGAPIYTRISWLWELRILLLDLFLRYRPFSEDPLSTSLAETLAQSQMREIHETHSANLKFIWECDGICRL